MNHEESGRRTPWLRWVARAVGTPVAAFWILVGIVSALMEEAPASWESLVLAGLILASAISVAAAWRWERAGGAAVVACGLAHAIFAAVAAGHNRGLAILVTGVPFLIAGALFLE
jgi:hypothetical protein